MKNKRIKRKIKTISYKEAFKEFRKNPKYREMVKSKRRYFETLIALKKTREKKGLSQEELAELAGLPRVTIARIETGQQNTTVDTLISMASAMGKRIEIKLL
jgi:DNA-binding XRE family transcriptional regulator